MDAKETLQPKPEPKWYIDCGEHGEQQAVKGTVKRWDQETEQLLREIGSLGEGEAYRTGDCPICHTTRSVHTHNPELTAKTT